MPYNGKTNPSGKPSMRSLLIRLSRLFSIAPVLAISALALVSAPAVLAAPISGTVTNATTNKPAVGDVVELIRLQQGMQVAARTKTDATGHFTLDIADNDPMHLVRVTHDGASYFKAAPPGTQSLDIQVFNASQKVKGITTEADVLRFETAQDGLHVTENFFVKNASSPPMTQFGPRAYQIALPKDATILAAAALGPGSMPVQSSPMPLDTPGAYAFVFPLRPGETRFQVSYRLPYSGSAEFQPHVSTPVDNYALILPKSMQFAGTPAASFQPIDQDVNVQTYVAKNLTPGMKLSFRISGSGQLPQEAAENSGGASPNASDAASQAPNPEAAAQAAAASSTRPGIGLGVPIDTPDPMHKYKWWILSIVAVLLAVGAGVSMKQASPKQSEFSRPASPAVAAAATAPVRSVGHRSAMLQALKEELFALESERLEGQLASEEYERQKNALEVVLKRALDRNAAQKPSAG